MNKYTHAFLLFLLPLLLTAPMTARSQSVQEERQWVDSVLSSLTFEQQIAQLMVVRVPTRMNETAERDFKRMIERTRVGGVCFFAGTAPNQLRLTKDLQRLSFVPLMVCMDAEWGLGMRLKDCFSFPRQCVYGTLPAAADTLVFDVGREIGRQCRMMGIHVNFAPVVDVNSNPNNPVIGRRAFSNDAERTTRLGIQYMLGLQSQGVMAVAKHFPGHGDTETDSHKTLPIVPHDRYRLDSVELRPFRGMITAGIMAVMIAHLHVPHLDTTPNLPSTLSFDIVTRLLRDELGFDGLTFTDGIDMKGLSEGRSHGEVAVGVLRAGNDVLLLPPDVDEAILAIREAAAYDASLRQQVTQSCRRVLTAKYRLGLNHLDLDHLSVPTAADSLRCEHILEGLRLNQDPRLDSVLLSGIQQRAYPGCQVVVLHHGQVVFRRAYGSFVYDDSLACKVGVKTMYDLASLTKVTATTLAIMKLVDNRQVALDDSLSRYLPYLRGSNKEGITIRQALSHFARLKPFDAYWAQTNDPDEIRHLIAESPLQKERKYLYSDLGFIMLGDLVRQVSGLPLDTFMQRHFYQPMGLSHTCFLPLQHGFDLDNMAPTEDEMQYRNRLIHGVVHDPNAFALGGVAGHAGLFSNADEVAALMQMLLDGGTYNGRKYLSAAVIDTFNCRHYAHRGNRRALGFDKPLINERSSHISPEASQSSFGHTGFTGTMVWADPQYDLVYVFLSNRVYPSASPNRLAQLNIRTDFLSLVYQDLGLTELPASEAMQQSEPAADTKANAASKSKKSSVGKRKQRK